MYSRELDGETLTFGVSGKLWKNALVMYDRQTRSLWSHMTGECLDGHYKGKRLEMLSAIPMVKWKTWRNAYPDTKVLTIRGREDQRRDNYWDYQQSGRTGLFPTEREDRRLKNKDLVIGVRLERQQKAYPIRKKLWKTETKGTWRLIQDRVGDVPLVVYHDPDNFTSAVYKRTVDDHVINFEPQAEGFWARDSDGNRWNLLTGAGPDGKKLEPIPHLNVYWFAWADFYPHATLYEE